MRALYILGITLFLSVGNIAEVVAQSVLPDTLRAVDARRWALKYHPAVQEVQAFLQAAAGNVRQAGLWPNPVVEFESEEIQWPEIGTTYGRIGQDILLGRKLKYQVRAAQADYAVVQQTLQLTYLDVAARATEAFYATLIAEYRQRLVEQLDTLADQLYATIAKMTEAGKLTMVDLERIRVEQTRIHARRLAAEAAVQAAYAQLATALGMSVWSGAHLYDTVDRLVSPPPFQQLVQKLRTYPVFVQQEAVLRSTRAQERVERAFRWPDIGITAGFQQLGENGPRLLTGGIALPLPLFNRNQGNIQRARAEVEAAQARLKALELELTAELQNLYSQHVAAFQEARLLKEQTLPAAMRAYQAIRTGYQEGKFNLLEVIDSQRTLFDVRMQYLDVLERYYRTRTQLQALTGELLAQ